MTPTLAGIIAGLLMAAGTFTALLAMAPASRGVPERKRRDDRAMTAALAFGLLVGLLVGGAL